MKNRNISFKHLQEAEATESLERIKTKEEQIMEWCRKKKTFTWTDVTIEFGNNGSTNTIWSKIIRKHAKKIKTGRFSFVYRMIK